MHAPSTRLTCVQRQGTTVQGIAYCPWIAIG